MTKIKTKLGLILCYLGMWLMNEKFILIPFIWLVMSCSKSNDLPLGECKSCSLISYKYDKNWKQVGNPITLWNDSNVCGRELLKVRSVKQIDTLGKPDCPELLPGIQYEIRRYIIN